MTKKYKGRFAHTKKYMRKQKDEGVNETDIGILKDTTKKLELDKN